MALSALVIADRYSGASMGHKMNAADADLGVAKGIIVVPPGSHSIGAQVVFSEDRTVVLGLGSYATSDDTYGSFIFHNRCRIVGHGWGTVINEKALTGNNAYKAVFRDHGSWTGGVAPGDNDGVEDVYFADFQIAGNPLSDFDSATPTLGLGNSRRVTIERVYLNKTRSIGINIGGTSNTGHHASDVWIKDCRFENVASQNISNVNGRRIHVVNNTLVAAGQAGGPGATYIDFEPNIATDWCDAYEISGNIIDARGAANAGNGILVQRGGATAGTVGGGVVANNVVYGGDFGFTTAAQYISTGILISGHNGVSVIGNKVRSAGQRGIWIDTCERVSAIGNTMSQCGGGGVEAMTISSSTNCTIKDNDLLFYTGANQGSALNLIVESGTSDYNIFQGNEVNSFSGQRGAIVLVGANSREFDNTFDGVKAKCFPYTDSAIAGSSGLLMKLDATTPGNVAFHTTADTKDDVIGVLLGAPSTGYNVALVVLIGDGSVTVPVKSDGTGTIGIGAAIQPSTTVNGHVKAGATNRIGRNAGASVAASLDAICTAMLN